MEIKLVWLFLLLWYQSSAEDSEIVNSENIPHIGDGAYKFSFETSNGIYREEVGQPQISKENTPFISVQGVYSYTAEDGNKVSVNYEADENGYREIKNGKENYPAYDLQRQLAALAGFQTKNGIRISEYGESALSKDNVPYIAVRGIYTYVLNQTIYTVSYEADENGFRPKLSQRPVGEFKKLRFGSAALASLVGGGLG